MPVETISEKAVEQSTFIVTVYFKDEDGNSVAPNVTSWSLYQAGTIVNSREDVSIIPAATMDIVLQGADLIEGISYLVITGTYDSAYGNDLPFKTWNKITVKHVPEI